MNTMIISCRSSSTTTTTNNNNNSNNHNDSRVDAQPPGREGRRRAGERGVGRDVKLLFGQIRINVLLCCLIKLCLLCVIMCVCVYMCFVCFR